MQKHSTNQFIDYPTNHHKIYVKETKPLETLEGVSTLKLFKHLNSENTILILSQTKVNGCQSKQCRNFSGRVKILNLNTLKVQICTVSQHFQQDLEDLIHTQLCRLGNQSFHCDRFLKSLMKTVENSQTLC